MKRPATKEMHEKMYQMYKNGHDYHFIAEEFGYSADYVRQVIGKEKEPAPPRKHLNDSDKQRIMELRGSGKKLREIAADIGISETTVQRYAKECTDQEKEDPEEDFKILMAPERKPQGKLVIVNGKRYRDVTDLFVGS